MGLHDGAHDGQAETVASRFSHAGRDAAHKGIEDAGRHPGRKAGPFVSDAEHNRFVARSERDGDRAPYGIAPGIGDERQKGLADARRVGLDNEIGEVELQMESACAQVVSC